MGKRRLDTPPIDDLSERVEERAIVEIKHVRTHDRGFCCEIGEGHETLERDGLDHNIVVAIDDVGRFARDAGFVHPAREAA